MCIAPNINVGLHCSVGSTGTFQILSRFFSAINTVDLICKDHGFDVKVLLLPKIR